MIRHIILFPIYAFLVFGIFVASYMVFWYIPHDYYVSYGIKGLLGYMSATIFFIWLAIAIAYLSKGDT